MFAIDDVSFFHLLLGWLTNKTRGRNKDEEDAPLASPTAVWP